MRLDTLFRLLFKRLLLIVLGLTKSQSWTGGPLAAAATGVHSVVGGVGQISNPPSPQKQLQIQMRTSASSDNAFIKRENFKQKQQPLLVPQKKKVFENLVTLSIRSQADKIKILLFNGGHYIG